MGKTIGIISFMKRGGVPPALGTAVKAFNLDVTLLDAEDSDLVTAVRESPVRDWVLTGSSWDIDARGAPQVPLELLRLRGKRFLLICYSHESLLWQLDVPLQRCERVKGWAPIDVLSRGRGLFGSADSANVWCNYNTWALAEDIPRGWKILATMGPVAMAIQRGHVTSMQFHPEMLGRGRNIFKEWLRA